MIPNIAVYAIHANHELNESVENYTTDLHKSNEQLSEAIFFAAIVAGNIIFTVGIVAKRHWTPAYYVVLIGTVSIIVFYFVSKLIGTPAPDSFDNWIYDYTLDWKDATTKICQVIYLIPLSMMLYREKERLIIL